MKAILSVVGLAVLTFLLFYMCACASAPAPQRAPAPAVAPEPVAVPVAAPERHLFSREAPTRVAPKVEAETEMEEPQHRVMSRAYVPKAKKIRKDRDID